MISLVAYILGNDMYASLLAVFYKLSAVNVTIDKTDFYLLFTHAVSEYNFPMVRVSSECLNFLTSKVLLPPVCVCK